MRGAIKSLRTVLLSVWLRLITISVIALLFTAILRDSPSRIGGWFFYLTIWEVLFELAVRVAAVALTGLVLGTVVTTFAAPFLCRETSRERLAESVLKTAVVFAAFCVFGVILKILFQSAHISIGKLAVVSYCVGFAVALGIPQTREWLSTSLDHFLDEKTVRRTAIGIAILLATVVIVERAIGMMTTETVHTIPAVARSGPNILMITFDALSAEDMSLYGYRLPTTPHIDEFARRSTVFTSVFFRVHFHHAVRCYNIDRDLPVRTPRLSLERPYKRSNCCEESAAFAASRQLLHRRLAFQPVRIFSCRTASWESLTSYPQHHTPAVPL